MNTETIRYCATCGEPEGSDYAKHCCTDDNMLEETYGPTVEEDGE